MRWDEILETVYGYILITPPLQLIEAMATLILLIFVGFLALIKEYNLGWILIRVVEFDDFYWKLIFILIIVFRVLLFIYRKVWVIRALLRKFYRWIDAGNQTNGAGPSGSLPSNGNGRRGYSTSATARTAKPRPMRPVKQLKPASRLSKTLRALKISFTGKLGNFFEVITKRGALVSLTKFERNKEGKTSRPRPTLSDLFRNVGFRMFGAVFTDKGKYLSRIRQLYSFLVHIDNHRRHKGSVWVVKYLKVSQLALQKSIAGTPVKSLIELEPDMRMVRTVSGGLPKWIPLRDRRLMLINHSPSIIRWYLTLFSVYRVISIPGKLKLETIYGGLTVLESQVYRVAQEVKLLVPVSRFNTAAFLSTETPYKVGRSGLPHLPFIEAASSTEKTSWTGMLTDVLVLRRNNLLNTLLKFLALTGQVHYLKLLTHIDSNLDVCAPFLDRIGKMSEYLPAGRLALKEEAAGKVRVFAMVTFWDQVALKPLHEMLFGFLRSLNNDATFDQHASVSRCMEKSTRAGCSFGYDLSAATDRLPLSLQKAILNQIFPGIGKVWGDLLVSRDYSLQTPKKVYQDFIGNYKYAVGQPMGALSSWAMLAITHHLIAQLAAHRARLHGSLDPLGFWARGWYEGYEVLGDDIVIFEKQVADQYLILMAELGVPINLAKSVVATNATFEFAKVTGHFGRHVAAISWAMFMAQPTVMGRVAICYSLLRKGIVKDKIIRYITRFSRESIYKMGLPNLFFLGLASMYANAGIFKLSELTHKVIDYRDGKLTLVPALFENSYGSIVRAFVRAVAEGTVGPDQVPISHKDAEFLDFEVQNYALKKALIRTIIITTYGSKSIHYEGHRVDSLRPSIDAANLARKMVLEMISFPTQEISTIEQALVKEGAFTLKPKVFQRLSPLGVLIHPLYCHLFFQIYTSLVRKWAALTSIKTIKLETLSLEELHKLAEEIDRYKEITQIISRKTEKEKGVSPLGLRLDSPLKVLINVLKIESKLDYMRRVVMTTGVKFVLTRAFSEKSTALFSILDPDHKADYPDLVTHPGAPSLAGVQAYVRSHGEDFVREHLPKWGKYAAAMFQAPSLHPRYDPWTYLMAQPDYLYSMSMFDSYLGDGETLTSHYSNLQLVENTGGKTDNDTGTLPDVIYVPPSVTDESVLDVEMAPR